MRCILSRDPKGGGGLHLSAFLLGAYLSVGELVELLALLDLLCDLGDGGERTQADQRGEQSGRQRAADGDLCRSSCYLLGVAEGLDLPLHHLGPGHGLGQADVLQLACVELHLQAHTTRGRQRLL